MDAVESTAEGEDEDPVGSLLLAQDRSSDQSPDVGRGAEMKRVAAAFGRPMLALAVPNCLALGAELLLPTVGTVFLGRKATLDQAAFVLGGMYCNAFGVSIIMGLAMGLDSLAPHAFGGNQKSLVGLYAQRAIVIGLLSCLPICALWLAAAPLLVYVFRVDEVTAQLAALFVKARLAGLPALCIFEMMRRFAQAQRLVWPAMVACGAGAVVHLIVTYFLVEAYGILGAGIAVSISCWVMCTVFVAVLVALRNTDNLKGSWKVPARSELFNWAGWLQFLRMALPSCLSLFLEWGGYEVYSAMASQLGTVALASQAIIGVTVGLFYIIPLGLSQAGATLVGNSLGAGRPHDAQSVALFCYALVGTYSVAQGGLAVLARGAYTRLFSTDEAVVEMTMSAFYLLWVYGLVDHVKCVGMSLLRSTGRPRITVVAVLVSQTFVGYPLAWFGKDWLGVNGIWAGLTVAWFATATVFAVVLVRTDWQSEVEEAAKQVSLGVGTFAGDNGDSQELVEMGS